MSDFTKRSGWKAGLATGLLALVGCAEPAGPAAGERGPLFNADSTSVQVPAGAQYDRRGWWWRRLWGEHYRRLWALPVTAPVLRLGVAGLQPVQVGGSFQTNVLRLRTPDGRSFVLRSVDKNLSTSVPLGVLAGLLRDQTCAAPPYGAYVAAALARAAGVYHTNPRLVYLLPDSALGRFRRQFRPALYLLEERPEQHHAPSFGGASLVTGSEQMLGLVLAAPTAHVAARAYLRARLLDMLLGDWSRRADQWRWAGFAGAGCLEFRPIPRDRDQAFFRFDDGWLTRALTWVRPRYQTYSPVLAPVDVPALTTTARPLDQTVLALLPEADFLAEADSLVRRLPATVLAHALQAVPPEARAAMIRQLLPALRSRLATLPAAAARYYQVLQADAVLVGTDAPAHYILAAAGPGRVRVQVWAHRPARPDSLLGQQLYDVRRTVRLCIYGLGGNDQFELRGRLAPGFAVHLYGGAGRNQFWQEDGRPANGTGLTIYASPIDLVRVPASVRVRPAPPALGTAAEWVRSYYRLGLGQRPGPQQ